MIHSNTLVWLRNINNSREKKNMYNKGITCGDGGEAAFLLSTQLKIFVLTYL